MINRAAGDGVSATIIHRRLREAGEVQIDVPRDLRRLGVQAASRPRIAPRTVEAHVENVRCKLEVCSRAQIAAWAAERRLRS